MTNLTSLNTVICIIICMTNKLNYAQWYVSELIGISLCLTKNKAQYIVLIHNRMHSLKIIKDCYVLSALKSVLNICCTKPRVQKAAMLYCWTYWIENTKTEWFTIALCLPSSTIIGLLAYTIFKFATGKELKDRRRRLAYNPQSVCVSVRPPFNEELWKHIRRFLSRQYIRLPLIAQQLLLRKWNLVG
jgi:hypothetical protein